MDTNEAYKDKMVNIPNAWEEAAEIFDTIFNKLSAFLSWQEWYSTRSQFCAGL